MREPAWPLAPSPAQVNKIVGKGAPEEFVGTLEELAGSHHEALQVDVIRAYHFGARFIVEARPFCPGTSVLMQWLTGLQRACMHLS